MKGFLAITLAAALALGGCSTAPKVVSTTTGVNGEQVHYDEDGNEVKLTRYQQCVSDSNVNDHANRGHCIKQKLADLGDWKYWVGALAAALIVYEVTKKDKKDKSSGGGTPTTPGMENGHLPAPRSNGSRIVAGGKAIFLNTMFWVTGDSFAAQSAAGKVNNNYLSDADIKKMIKIAGDAGKLRSNESGTRPMIGIKVALFPLMDDGVTWNMAMVKRIQSAIKYADKQGVYVQLHIWDTWARVRGQPFEDTINSSASTRNGANHVINAWTGGAKQNQYVRNLAKFFHKNNVIYLMGNEVDHSNSGQAFANAANSYYQVLRNNVPAGTIMGTNYIRNFAYPNQGNIDIVHNATNLPNRRNKPIILDELAAGSQMWRNSVICNRSQSARYIRAAQEAIQKGYSGTALSTWVGQATGGSGGSRPNLCQPARDLMGQISKL